MLDMTKNILLVLVASIGVSLGITLAVLRFNEENAERRIRLEEIKAEDEAWSNACAEFCKSHSQILCAVKARKQKIYSELIATDEEIVSAIQKQKSDEKIISQLQQELKERLEEEITDCRCRLSAIKDEDYSPDGRYFSFFKILVLDSSWSSD